MDLVIVLPCLVKYVPSWAITTANMRQLNQMGMSWRTSFTSSTWFTEQSLHGFLFSLEASFSSMITALSRNLQNHHKQNNSYRSIIVPLWYNLCCTQWILSGAEHTYACVYMQIDGGYHTRCIMCKVAFGLRDLIEEMIRGKDFK